MTSILVLRHRRIIVIAFLIAAVSALFIPDAAQAAMIIAADDEPGGTWTSPTEGQFADDYLPIFRWSDASSDMHTRVGGGDQWDAIKAMNKSDVAGSFIIAGNFFFSLVTGLTKIAIEFTPLDAAGKEVDEAFAKIGEAIIDSPLLAVLIVVCLLTGLFVAVRQSHGRPMAKTLFKPLMLIAVFSVLVSGASASTESKPGSFSPWWIGNTINDIVTEVATAPTEALQKTDLGFKLELNSEAGGPNDPMACEAYLSSLKETYKEGSDGDPKMSRSIAVSLSNMWEATALDSYIDVQFGRQSPEGQNDNVYGDRVFCRMLEQNSAKSADDQVALMDGIEIQDGDKARNSGAFKRYGVDETDVSMMYWSACKFEDGKFVVDENWKKIKGAEKLGDGSDGYSCSKWWDNPPNTINPNSESKAQDEKAPLNFVGDLGKINEKLEGSSTAIHNFVYATQGWSSTDASINAIIYAFSSLCVAFAFGVLALIIFGSKIGMIVMLLLLGIAIIADAIPTARGGKIGKYFLSYLGMAFLAFGVQLIYAVVVFLTSVIAGAGSSFVGQGMMRNVWLGLSAVISFVLLHLFITKWMKAPSPFTLSGASALMAGAAGGKLLGSGMSALRNRGRKAGQGGDGSGGGVGGGSGNAGSLDADGNKETGTTDKMDPALGGSGDAGGGSGEGTSDGADPVDSESGAPAVVGAGGGDADGDAVGGTADGAPAIGGDADGDEDGRPAVAAGGAGAQGAAGEVGGDNADGAPALSSAGDDDADGAPAVAAGAGALGAAGAGANAGGGGGSGAQALDKADKKRDKREAKARAFEKKAKDNNARHMVMANNGAGPNASLGQKIGHKAKVLGSSARNLGANSALRARAGIERKGGVAAVGAQGASKGLGYGIKGAGHAARWTAKNAGKAGMVAAVAGGAALAAPVVLPAGLATAAVMTGGGLVGSAAAVKGGFNVTRAGARDAKRGVGAGYRGTKSVIRRGGAAGVQGVRNVAAQGGSRALQVAESRWNNLTASGGKSIFGKRIR